MITASVLRHGPTHYTNVFPDLSEEHLSLLDATAWDIMQNFQGKTPTFISSPTPRTIASAIRIAQAYGMNLEPEDIPQDPLIGPLHRVEHAIDFLRDKIAHLEHNVDPLVRHNILDSTYMEDPVFLKMAFYVKVDHPPKQDSFSFSPQFEKLVAMISTSLPQHISMSLVQPSKSGSMKEGQISRQQK